MITLNVLRLVLDDMTPVEREAWAKQVREGAQNALKAAQALQGNRPDVLPDPNTWAIGWLSIAFHQLEEARLAILEHHEKATDKRPSEVTNRKEMNNGESN